MDPARLALLATAVLAGSATQRVTGVGFALVSSPFLVLLLGPLQGVQLANSLSLTTNLLVMALTWRGIEVRRLLLLVVPAVAIVPLGAWVTDRLPTATLLVLVGSIAVASLLATVLVRRARVLRGRSGAVAAGGLSGFMNVTAGIGGPGVTLYAVSADWAHAGFVATMQPYFALVNLASILAKGVPTLSPVAVAVALGALGVGAVVGQLLSGRVAATTARHGTTALALAGASATVVKGALLLAR